jgi:hypothetical protein
MANDGFIEFLSPNALKQLEDAKIIVDALALQIEQINKFKAPKSPSGADNTVKQMTADLKAQQTTIESLRKQLADLSQQRRNEDTIVRSQILTKRELQRQVDAEIKSNLQAIGLYGRINSELNVLKNTYRDLAVKKELGEQLNKREQESLTKSFDKLTKYDQALKKVDASMGIHGRSVGNYASGFNPLSNSISQITRELPNFGQSLQIGILSLTNNIGAFQDAITGIREQNKLLKEDGQAVKSVFSQVASAFLSWNTLLYVGIGLLSAYGKEIGVWVSSLFEGNQALKELNENQKEFNNSRTKGIKDAQAELLELRKYLAVVNDRKLSDEQRKIAQDAILKQYPYYIRSVQEAMLVDGQYSKGVNDLIIALEKRKEVEAKSEINVKNSQKLVDLEKELSLQTSLEKKAKQNLDRGVKNQISSQAIASLSDRYNSVLQKRIEIEKTIDATSKQIIKNESDIIQLKKETIGLEFSPEKDKANKQQKDRIRLNYEEVKSLYDLEIAKLKEKQILQKEITDNQDAPDYTRLEARKEYSRLAVEILDKQYKKEQALALENLTDNLNKAEEQYQKNIENGYNDVKNNEEFAKAKADIEATFLNETELALINHSRNWQNLMYEDADFNEKIKKATFDKEEKLRKQTIKDINDLNDAISKSEQEKNLKISNNERLTLQTRQKGFQEYQHQALLQLQRDKQRETTGKETITQLALLDKKYKDLADAITSLETPLDVANQKMKDFLNNATFDTINKGLDSLGLNSLKIFTDIDENGQSTFNKLFEAAKLTGQEFAVTFQAVGDVFQDVMNMMMEASNRRFEAEKQQLEEQTKIAIAFAGDSDTARAEIERQAEARRKEIAAREFKAKKQQAIFNIAIDTAQAIISIWAQVPKVDFGISAGLLSAFVGALGLAQIAMVQSQQPPAYKMGTDNHIGGAMLVNDGAGSNYKETIQTPDGKIYQPKERNVIMNAPKGTKVFTHDQWQRNLDNILTSNSINYSQPNVVVNSGMSDEQVDRIVNTIANKQEAILSIDKNGWNTSVRNGHTQKEILNNQVTFGR